MGSHESDFSSGEVTHQSVREQIKLATEPILWQVERLIAQLTDRIDLKTTGDSEATGLRREDTCTSSVGKRFDTGFTSFGNPPS